MPDPDFYFPGTIVDAVRRGEPVYTLPIEEREPERTFSAAIFAEEHDSRDWSHTNLNIKPLHEAGKIGKDVVIGVLDTGCDINHPDLQGQFVEVGNRDGTGSPNGFMDSQGHGTHTFSTILAATNGKGMIGIAPGAKGMVLKVLNNEGSGASSWIAALIRHGVDMGCHILSGSFGGQGIDNQIRAAVDYAISKGVWCFFAAGNDSGPGANDPAQYKGNSIAATDQQNKRASFSTINQNNTCSAPGVNIMAALPNNRYGTMSGTSMACPTAAGCAAIVYGALLEAGAPIPSHAEFQAAIKQFSKDLAPAGHDSSTGAGLIDPARLIVELLGPIAPPPPVCPPGQHWDVVAGACVPDVIEPPPPLPVCPVGWHWDAAQQKCVKDLTPPQPPGGGTVTKEKLKSGLLALGAFLALAGATTIADIVNGVANSELALNGIMLVLKWIGIGTMTASTTVLALNFCAGLTPAQKAELKAALGD